MSLFVECLPFFLFVYRLYKLYSYIILTKTVLSREEKMACCKNNVFMDTLFKIQHYLCKERENFFMLYSICIYFYY